MLGGGGFKGPRPKLGPNAISEVRGRGGEAEEKEYITVSQFFGKLLFFSVEAKV
jgi:hypothetical protein